MSDALIPFEGGSLALPTDVLEGIREWLEGRNVQTHKAYLGDMRQFLTWLRERQGLADLRALRPGHIVRYRSHLRDERALAVATIARKLSAVRSMLDYAVTAELLSVNPAKAVKAYRVPDVSPRHALSNEQVRALFAAPDRHTLLGARDYAMLMALAYLGPRRVEVSALRCEQFHRERGHVALRLEGKGGKHRLLPVPPRVQEAIKGYLALDGRPVRELEELERRGAEPLWRSLRSTGRGETPATPVGPITIWRRVKACAEAAGMPALDVHTLRHTALTAALDGGASLRRVQAMAGHSDPKTTARYDSRRESLDDAAVHRISYE